MPTYTYAATTPRSAKTISTAVGVAGLTVERGYTNEGVPQFVVTSATSLTDSQKSSLDTIAADELSMMHRK